MRIKLDLSHHLALFLCCMRTILTQLLIDEYMDLMTFNNMEAIMFSILRLEIVFSNTRSLENWGIINNYSMSARWI